MRHPLWVYIVCLRPNIRLGPALVAQLDVRPTEDQEIKPQDKQTNIGLLAYIGKVQVDISASKPDQTPLTVESGLGIHYYVQILDSWLILVRYKLIFLQANYEDPNQTLLTAASSLGLHCLPTSKTWILDLYWLGFLKCAEH